LVASSQRPSRIPDEARRDVGFALSFASEVKASVAKTAQGFKEREF